MATLLERIGSALGLGNSQTLVSGNTTLPGTEDIAFHLDIQQPGATGGQLLVAAPDGATIIAPDDEWAVIIGQEGDDRLSGGEQADLLVGGEGINVMTGGGGTDVFGHAEGALDVIVDFSPAAGERIALQDGLTVTGSTSGTIDPADFGLVGAPGQAVTLSFSDGSNLVLLNLSDTPDASWLI